MSIHPILSCYLLCRESQSNDEKKSTGEMDSHEHFAVITRGLCFQSVRKDLFVCSHIACP